MVEAVCVDPGLVHLIWPKVSHWIKNALDGYGDAGSFVAAERDVLAGTALLWLVWNNRLAGAVVTQITNNEASKICTIVACGGDGMRHWVHLIEKIEDYARAEDCRCVRIVGRGGWRRILKNYATVQVTLERLL